MYRFFKGGLSVVAPYYGYLIQSVFLIDYMLLLSDCDLVTTNDGTERPNFVFSLCCQSKIIIGGALTKCSASLVWESVKSSTRGDAYWCGRTREGSFRGYATPLYLLSKYDRTKIQIRALFKTLSVETVMLGSFNCRCLWSYCFYRLLSSRA